MGFLKPFWHKISSVRTRSSSTPNVFNILNFITGPFESLFVTSQLFNSIRNEDLVRPSFPWTSWVRKQCCREVRCTCCTGCCPGGRCMTEIRWRAASPSRWRHNFSICSKSRRQVEERSARGIRAEVWRRERQVCDRPCRRRRQWRHSWRGRSLT